MEEKAGLIIFAQLSLHLLKLMAALIVFDDFLSPSYPLFPIISVKKVENPLLHCFSNSKGLSLWTFLNTVLRL